MNRLTTLYEVLHHTTYPQGFSKKQTEDALKRDHAGDNRDGLPSYHVVIGEDFVVYPRPILTVGYHAGNYPVNLTSIGIALNGNFLYDIPTKYQRLQLREHIQRYMRQFAIPRSRVKLHNEVRLSGPTACPGISQLYIDELLKEENLNELRAAINSRFRAIYKREPEKADNDYYLSRIGQPEHLGGIKTLAKLIDVMKYYASLPKELWLKERKKVLK